MFKTPQLSLSYKKLILKTSAFYLAVGLSLDAIINAFNHPENILISLLGLSSNLLFYSNKYYILGGWFLVFTLALMFLPYLPFMVARTFRLTHISFHYAQHGRLIDLVSDDNSRRRGNLAQPTPLQASKSGVISGNKGMMMVADGKIMFVNKEFCQMSGYSPIEVIGRDFVELILEQDLLKYTHLIRTPENGFPMISGIGIRSANQRELEVYIAGSRNTAANPNDICLFYLKDKVFSTSKNLTSADLLIQSVSHSDVCFWMWDERGMIFINEKCRRMINVPLGLVMRRPVFILKAVGKDQRRAIVKAYYDYLETKTFDQEIQTAKGWYRVVLTTAMDMDGRILHHIGTAYDINAQRQKVAELEYTCSNAVKANYNKTAFLANMSHEIRSPLNGILGFSELLADPDLAAFERERYIDIIKNNGIALLSLLTDIIDISKLESGKMKIQEKEFLPSDLMNELQLQYARDPMATHKALTLTWQVSDEMSQTTILSDPFRVRQVLVNLITNALKFTDRGNVEIGAERWGDQAVFWVKDSGIGMSQENLLVIFDRFRQVAKTASTHTNGFGLGLAISKMLIELLGGHIWLESELNNGTVFYFTIPYSTPKPTEMNNTNTGETAFPYDWKGRTILIAEDIDFSFLYIEAVLRRTGARVLWAQNGREAIEMVKVNPGIDIALMDIHMPVMNGYEATREIIKIRPDLPVIAQTAFVLPDDVKACYAAGCAGYLAKPIRREQLLNTLTDYFEKIDQNAQVQSGNMPVYRSKISG